MSIEENKAVVRRWAEELWNQGNLAVADEIYGPQVLIHEPERDMPDRGGPTMVKQRHGWLISALPDFQIMIEDLLAEGDKVMVRWTGRGTHQGELLGVPPTGKQVTVSGINVMRIEDGKIVERWGITDDLDLLHQLGVELPASK
ncbi:MAG: ester cyclase [Chloroflexota bacterium]|nr:ester cyclase [Chloroflexota bacterium]